MHPQQQLQQLHQVDLEEAAAGLVKNGDVDGARAMLAHHANESAVAAVSSYHTLFDTLVARYHDGYQMEVRNESETQLSCVGCDCVLAGAGAKNRLRRGAHRGYI